MNIFLLNASFLPSTSTSTCRNKKVLRKPIQPTSTILRHRRGLREKRITMTRYEAPLSASSSRHEDFQRCYPESRPDSFSPPEIPRLTRCGGGFPTLCGVNQMPTRRLFPVCHVRKDVCVRRRTLSRVLPGPSQRTLAPSEFPRARPKKSAEPFVEQRQTRAVTDISACCPRPKQKVATCFTVLQHDPVDIRPVIEFVPNHLRPITGKACYPNRPVM